MLIAVKKLSKALGLSYVCFIWSEVGYRVLQFGLKYGIEKLIFESEKSKVLKSIEYIAGNAPPVLKLLPFGLPKAEDAKSEISI